MLEKFPVIVASMPDGELGNTLNELSTDEDSNGL
jgi:hypothetical protein